MASGGYGSSQSIYVQTRKGTFGQTVHDRKG